MKWYRIIWQELVAVEIPRPLDGVRWWPWWLRRPARHVKEWQARSIWIEADGLIDVQTSTLHYDVRYVQFEEVSDPGRWGIITPEATAHADSPHFEADGCAWEGIPVVSLE